MNTPMRPKDSGGPTDAEIEVAIHEALRSEGCSLPKTPAEVTQLKAALNLSHVPTPNSHKFRALLRKRVEGKIVPLPNATRAVDENLALAARNGGKITAEIRNKMDAARAEDQKRNPRS